MFMGQEETRTLFQLSPVPLVRAATKPFQIEPNVASRLYLGSELCHLLRCLEVGLLCFLLVPGLVRKES